jgi:hypothetical protein
VKKIAIYIGMVLGLYACVESDIVEKYNAAQVKTMLTDNNVKTWFQSEYKIDGVVQPIDDCQDTVRLVFKIIKTDSITAYELRYDGRCELFDTTKLGELNISFFQTLFTDSLNLTTNTFSKYWKPTYIGPKVFSVFYKENGKEINKTFLQMEAGLLARQVAVWLTGYSDPDSSKTYRLTKRNSDGGNITLSKCSDTLQVVFSRDNSRNILMHQLTPNADCTTNQSEFFGQVTVQSEGELGFFNGKLSLTNGSIESIDISSISQKGFVGSFIKNGVEEVVTYVDE